MEPAGDIDNGGPAFPPPIIVAGPIEPASFEAVARTMQSGVTVRDYFAGQALAGQAAYEGLEGCGGDGGASDVAAWAYELADAMLAERAKRRSAP